MAAGLAAAQCAADDIVAVHDGARPLVLPEVIEAAIAALVADDELDGIVLANPASDTLKQAQSGRVVRTLDRSVVWAAQTPQIFRARALLCALDVARADGFIGTDDSALVEHSGGTVALFAAPRDNVKITVAEDAAIAEAVLRYREAARA
jgi:2-C-methyl-D-erythritol 4-phosphate cytidylyltransferase